MAGYIFAVDKKVGIERIIDFVHDGYYSTSVNCDAKHPTSFEATLGDYCTMRKGDYIFFFSDRNVYGAGKLTKVLFDCKYQNYPEACKLLDEYTGFDDIKNKILFGPNETDLMFHWICFFEPCPEFYLDGVDMDDLLQYKPETISELRTFWKKSFIKVGDDEANTIRDFLMLRNHGRKTMAFSPAFHNVMKSKITKDYLLSPDDLAINCLSGTEIRHEMALEAILLKRLSAGKDKIFGTWDYLSQQVCASPFKPVDYMDKIDIFGYKYLRIGKEKVISKFLVIELKAGEADIDAVNQISKYIDWVCKKYTFGDYNRIEAFIVAHGFDNLNIGDAKKEASRNFNIGSHPILFKTWSNLRFVKYDYCKKLKLREVR